jgi:hypothetical protein
MHLKDFAHSSCLQDSEPGKSADIDASSGMILFVWFYFVSGVVYADALLTYMKRKTLWGIYNLALSYHIFHLLFT